MWLARAQNVADDPDGHVSLWPLYAALFVLPFNFRQWGYGPRPKEAEKFSEFVDDPLRRFA